MDDFNIKLKILSDILTKKEEALSLILNICENQTVVYAQPPSAERTEFINEMGGEKQRLIEDVIKYDDVFSGVFTEISDVFEERSKGCLTVVERLQTQIKAVMDIDIKIRAREAEAKELAYGQPHKQNARNNTFAKSYITEQYKRNAKPERD